MPWLNMSEWPRTTESGRATSRTLHAADEYVAHTPAEPCLDELRLLLAVTVIIAAVEVRADSYRRGASSDQRSEYHGQTADDRSVGGSLDALERGVTEPGKSYPSACIADGTCGSSIHARILSLGPSRALRAA